MTKGSGQSSITLVRYSNILSSEDSHRLTTLGRGLANGRNEDEAFLELGLLMIVTGLTIAIAVGATFVFLLELFDGRLQPVWIAVFGSVIAAVSLLGVRLARRLRPFLRGLSPGQ
jgi:hypothetical protein